MVRREQRSNVQKTAAVRKASQRETWVRCEQQSNVQKTAAVRKASQRETWGLRNLPALVFTPITKSQDGQERESDRDTAVTGPGAGPSGCTGPRQRAQDWANLSEQRAREDHLWSDGEPANV
ncbi:hypothetical protein E5288_WYG011508 [Bos mutus]|uniref:Uncharacterized protein n=1 Tax=Bos mutus TaxID=72004 RepID=A0A6B0RP98_9CETA|nr:hypothetical protein [Bos mutus]